MVLVIVIVMYCGTGADLGGDVGGVHPPKDKVPFLLANLV
jgi:hypothetical protein